MSRFQNALFLGDVRSRVAVLRETGQCESLRHHKLASLHQDPLAYYTATTNGLDDTALDILEEAGMTEDDLPPPPQSSGHSSLSPPPIAFPQSDSNWPVKNLGESFFDRALANGGGVEGLTSGGESSKPNGTAQEELDAWAADDAVTADEGDDQDEGWDLDAEVVAPPPEEAEEEMMVGDTDLSEGVSQGVGEDEMWVRNSPLAADHAAAGSFESAMQVRLGVILAVLTLIADCV